jgi:serine/threonine protein kinase
MTTPYPSEADREQRLNEVLLAYVEAVEAGQAPDRRQYLAGYPEFASELAEFFASRDQLERLASPLREVARGESAPIALLDRRPGVPGRASRNLFGPEPQSASPLGQLGDFRLLREIGRGGMGVVYEAEQISLNRPVALKILPFAAALDPKHLQRFKNEAQAAAHLHHTNIVPVHAVGYERGVHYYAMQLIEGQSLAAMIRELRQIAQSKAAGQVSNDAAQSPLANELVPSGFGLPNLTSVTGEKTGPYVPSSATGKVKAPAPEPTTNQAAAALPTERSVKSRHFFRRVAHLGLKAAEALEHAHQQGVIHRDVKPANLLVDVRGNLWITDFGLALFQSDMGLTTTGELLGTLRYMSPEQALAKRALVDHRTDIYSLGVTLYEVLTLQPAFNGSDRQELLQQITQEDPTPPRGIDKGIPVELETIVLKAIAKTPAERYATAQEMADDLQRFLDDKPVLARRPTLIDKVRKWQRRHKAVVVSAIVSAFLVLGVAALGLLFANARITEEQDKTRDALRREQVKAKEAEEQRQRAVVNLQQARGFIEFITQFSEEALADKPDLKRRLLEASYGYYKSFIDQSPNDPSDDLVASLTRLSNILDELGSPVAAFTNCQKALSIMEEAARTRPNDPRIKRLVESIRHHLISLQGGGQLLALTQREVRVELAISEDQRKAIAQFFAELSIQEKLWKPRRGYRDPGLTEAEWEEWHKKFEELRRANEKQVAGLLALLTPEQTERLWQISRQLRLPNTFRDDEEVEQVLRITPDQRVKIQIVTADYWSVVHKAMHDPTMRNADPEQGRKNREEARRTATAKILTLLTDDQRIRWAQLVGKPFTASVRMGPGAWAVRPVKTRFDHPGNGCPPPGGPPPRLPSGAGDR